MLAQAVRGVAAAVEDEMALDPAERTADDLVALGSDFRYALTALIRGIRSASERLTAAAPCHDATTRAVEVWNDARAAIDNAEKRPATDQGRTTAIRQAEAVVVALEIEPDLMDLVILDARLQVATALSEAGVKIRLTAERAGLTPGYVSELKSMARPKGGLLSSDAAMRLDSTIQFDSGVSLRRIVTTTNDLIEEMRHLRHRMSRRASPPVIGGKRIPSDLRSRDRIEIAAEALRRDDQLLRGVEHLVALGQRERRAIIRMLDELADQA